MRYVQLSDDASTVTGVFERPQPGLQNYAEIADNDPRLVSRSLAAARAAAINALSMRAAAEIVAGFASTALGGSHVYPSNLTDQQNLAANVLSSLLPGLAGDWTTPQLCADASGAWDYRLHSAAQIQQVGADAKTRIAACLMLKAQFANTIAASPEPALVNIEAGWPD